MENPSSSHGADLWEGWDDLSEPPAEADDSAVTAEERRDIDLREFWKSRHSLAHLHDFARSRLTGPWAVLGSALARVVAHTPPGLVLPPTVGGVASLNLFVGLVGLPGAGKDAAQTAARLAVHCVGADRVLEAPLGSGEGLSHMFMRPPPVRGPEAEPVQYNHKALVRIGEIDTFAALQNRQSSTLSTQLRHAAMGEDLGFWYVDVSKRLIVPRHRYRLCLVAGIQPARSGVLLSDADGGTPQRWLWLPAEDPLAPDSPPDRQTPMVWTMPDLMQAPREHEDQTPFYTMTLPQIAVDTQIKVRRAGLRGDATGLDGHAMITRTKVAAALALLEERIEVTEEDWRLSGVIMAVSDGQRARCQRALASQLESANHSKAVAEAERAVVVGERIDQQRRRRAASAIKRRLARVPGGEAAGRLRAALASQDRDLFEDVMDALCVADEVVAEAIEHHGSRTVRYRLK